MGCLRRRWNITYSRFCALGNCLRKLVLLQRALFELPCGRVLDHVGKTEPLQAHEIMDAASLIVTAPATLSSTGLPSSTNSQRNNAPEPGNRKRMEF